MVLKSFRKPGEFEYYRAAMDTQMIEQYEEGYRRQPESMDEIKAMEELSAAAFVEEGWK